MNNQTKYTTAPPLTAQSLTASAFSSPVLKAPQLCTTVTSVTGRITTLFLLLLATLLLSAGCKTKHTISEKTITKTDSTAICTLNDSLFKKETQIANLQINLQRLREENARLSNKTSTHQISYDTSAPLNPQTGKPPVASESFTISKSTLEETKKEHETLFQTASLENESLNRQNLDLQLKVENLTNENKQLTGKTTTSGFNTKIFFTGLFFGLVFSIVFVITVRKYIK